MKFKYILSIITINLILTNCATTNAIANKKNDIINNNIQTLENKIEQAKIELITNKDDEKIQQ